jgi:hypothetical protein
VRLPVNRYTLVVIDIQPEFEWSARKVLAPVKQEIHKAMQALQPILFVEYQGSGETLVKPEVQGYRRHFTATKANDGGSREVQEAIRRFRLPRNNLRVCGVNTDYCVYSTIKGLDNPKIEVVAPACWSDWEGTGSPANHNAGLQRLAKLPNVVIVAA